MRFPQFSGLQLLGEGRNERVGGREGGRERGEREAEGERDRKREGAERERDDRAGGREGKREVGFYILSARVFVRVWHVHACVCVRARVCTRVRVSAEERQTGVVLGVEHVTRKSMTFCLILEEVNYGLSHPFPCQG